MATTRSQLDRLIEQIAALQERLMPAPERSVRILHRIVPPLLTEEQWRIEEELHFQRHPEDREKRNVIIDPVAERRSRRSSSSRAW